MPLTIGIVGGGPTEHIPSLHPYREDIDYWIGADAGAVTILDQGIALQTAIGDFDSISETALERIKQESEEVFRFPEEKDETDLELAVTHALQSEPRSIVFFGVTGGRLDHTLANLQLLYRLMQKQVHGKIIDQLNEVTLYSPGSYTLSSASSTDYPYISFLPMSERVRNLTLDGFYYPLHQQTINWGSTLCLSNKLVSEKGTFLFDDGILILLKSRDQMTQTNLTI